MDFTTNNRGNRHSIKEFEKDLLKEGLLRLRPFMKKTIKGVSLKDFITNFLKDYNKNNELENITVDDEEVFCAQNKRRSGGDIFRLCKYYYPKTTLLEVLAVLDEIILQDTKKEYKVQICEMINKRVYSYWGEKAGNHYHLTDNDEFNRKQGEYVREYKDGDSKKSTTEEEWSTKD